MANVYLLQTELIGNTNRERKPPTQGSRKILSYVPEKKVRQAINLGTPVAVAKTR